MTTALTQDRFTGETVVEAQQTFINNVNNKYPYTLAHHSNVADQIIGWEFVFASLQILYNSNHEILLLLNVPTIVLERNPELVAGLNENSPRQGRTTVSKTLSGPAQFLNTSRNIMALMALAKTHHEAN
jgi:hypothetical protein